MLFYSLNKSSEKVTFKEAMLKGQAPDKGLYFPEVVPRWESDFVNNLKHLDKYEIGYHVMKPYVGDSISSEKLMDIIKETLSFEIPLQQITENIFCLELFHGPTLAFKDLGARFLSRCMGYFSKEQSRKTVVLVATSGDTGGAVADGFHHVEGIEVIILYPSGKVSPVQEKQLTALGGNIHAIEIQGDFDACQRLVKMAFSDEDLQQNAMLTSANSINVARWLSQQLFYVLAYSQWNETNAPSFAVPSGNFGNICAGMVAERSGLPVNQFIAACNQNDVFTRFLKTDRYDPLPSIQTISNAMDVGDPSNFSRIIELYGNDLDIIKSMVCSFAISDDETKQTIEDVYKSHDYILDPHTAVAYSSMKNWQKNNPNKKGIILGTAHPLKFPTVVKELTKKEIEVPEKIKSLMQKEKKSILMPDNYAYIKKTINNIIDSTLV